MSKWGVICYVALLVLAALFWQALIVAVVVTIAMGLTMWWLSAKKAPHRSKDFSQWAVVSQLAYNIPESPPFRTLREHQEAVHRIYRRRYLGATRIANETLLPIVFVAAVLRLIEGRRDDEGGAAVGARLKPRDPDPRNAAE